VRESIDFILMYGISINLGMPGSETVEITPDNMRKMRTELQVLIDESE
jgi:hypothetical protein